VCRVLEEDPDLAEAVPVGRRQQAIESFVAPVVIVPTGLWMPPPAPDPGATGMLILDGLLIRKIAVGDRYSVVLLGVGDVIQPWTAVIGHDGHQHPDWVAFTRTRLAMLDGNFTRLLGQFPELAPTLVERVVQRSRDIAMNMAIASHTRVDTRLHMLLWSMASRWGRIRPDGVLLPLRLTHQVLGELVAARRPTVTTALSELAEQGLIQPVEDGWLLKGDPPSDVLAVS
jgi:CRP/FNR family transcriptional regulator, cyclic AMP receptor protein